MKINYWNTAMPTGVCIIYECFQATMVKSSSCCRNHSTYKTNDITICAYTGCPQTPDLDDPLQSPYSCLPKSSFLLPFLVRAIWANGGKQRSKYLPRWQRFFQRQLSTSENPLVVMWHSLRTGRACHTLEMLLLHINSSGFLWTWANKSWCLRLLFKSVP